MNLDPLSNHIADLAKTVPSKVAFAYLGYLSARTIRKKPSIEEVKILLTSWIAYFYIYMLNYSIPFPLLFSTVVWTTSYSWLLSPWTQGAKVLYHQITKNIDQSVHSPLLKRFVILLSDQLQNISVLQKIIRITNENLFFVSISMLAAISIASYIIGFEFQSIPTKLTFLYLSFLSLEAIINKPGTEEAKLLIYYWMVLPFISVFRFLILLPPGYSVLIWTLTSIWLFSPWTKGVLVIYYSLIKDNKNKLIPGVKLPSSLVKQKLVNLYHSFNSEHAFASFYQSSDNSLSLYYPQEFKDNIRKHGLKSEVSQEIVRNLLNPKNVDAKAMLKLAESLKHLITGSQEKEIQLSTLIHILKKNDDIMVRSEIAWCLALFLQNHETNIDNELLDKITEQITNLSPKAESFLIQELTKHARLGNLMYPKKQNSKIQKLAKCSTPQVIVTKAQEVIKVKAQDRETQEASVYIPSLAEAIKSKTKQIKNDSHTEILPPIKDNGSSDQSIWRDTYQETEHLYNIAMSKHSLKDDDKDNYLPSVFFERSKKYFCNPNHLALYMDRLIAATFLEISKNQILSKEAFEKLIFGLNNIEVLKEKIFEKKDEDIIMTLQESLHNKFFHTPFPELTKTLSNIDPNNKSQILEVVREEIRHIRLDSIATIKNCVIRDKGMLTKDHIKAIEKCLEDEDLKMQRFALSILSTLPDNKGIDHEKIFASSLSQLESNEEDIMQSISFLYNQTADIDRCLKLFTEETIEFLVNLIAKPSASDYLRINCGGIINNYLGQSSTKGLSVSTLEKCIKIFTSSPNQNVKFEILKSILFTAEKDKRLPVSIVYTLCKELKFMESNYANMTIMMLGTIDNKVPHLEHIAEKLCDTYVIVGEGDSLKFEERSQYNSGAISISSIAAKIILKTIESDILLAVDILGYLTRSLDAVNKETRILGAKALFLALKHCAGNKHILEALRDKVSDTVVDVAVYTTLAYSYGLVSQSRKKESISQSDMDFLSKVYVYGTLTLGDVDYKSQVNENIFEIMLNEAKKVTYFPDEIYSILEFNLFYNSEKHQQTLDILSHKTNKKQLLPITTIYALETIIEGSLFSSKALDILKTVIRNGQPVSDDTLKKLADNLYLSLQSDIRNSAIELLDTANRNQDIPDEIFEVIEMERAGRVVKELASKADIKSALIYLQKCATNSKKLPQNTFEALDQLLQAKDRMDDKHLSIETLRVLVCAAENKQILPTDLLASLVARFQSKENISSEFVRLINAVIKANQYLPNSFFEAMEKFLDHETDVLSIFLLKGQKGDQLSLPVIKAILNKFLQEKDPFIQQEYIPTIASIIINNTSVMKNNESANLMLASEALNKALSHENPKLKHYAIQALTAFSKLNSLSDETLTTLVDIMVSTDDQACKTEIQMLLDRQKLKHADEHVLDCIIKLSAKGIPLLAKSFSQIERILRKNPALQSNALKALISTSNKQDISDELFNIIITLLPNISDKQLKQDLLQLIQMAAEAGRKFTISFIALLNQFNQIPSNDETALKSIIEIIKVIEKNQEIPSHLALSFTIKSSKFENDKGEIEIFLEKVEQGLQKGTSFPSLIIDQLLKFAVNCAEDHVQPLARIFSILILTKQIKPGQFNANIFFEMNIIKDAYYNLDIIRAYRIIIRENCEQDLEQTLNALSLTIINDEPEETVAILECLNQTASSHSLPLIAIQALEANLGSSNQISRVLAFQGLLEVLKKGHKSEKFNLTCQEMLKNISEELGLKLSLELDHENLALLQIISSLKFISTSSLKKLPRIKRDKELLLSDLITSLNLSYSEKASLYMLWLEVDFHFDREEKSLQILKSLHYAQCVYPCSFDQFQGALIYLKDLEFCKASEILSDVYLDWYIRLEQKWLTDTFERKCLKINNNTEISDILGKLNSGLLLTILEKVEKIDNIPDLEGIVTFIQNHQISAFDLEKIPAGPLTSIKFSLELTVLINKSNEKAKNFLKSLLDKTWSFEKLRALLESLKGAREGPKINYLINVLKTVDYYHIPSSYESQIAEILKLRPEEWVFKVNQLAVKHNFQEVGKIKDLQEISKEVINANLKVVPELTLEDLQDIAEKVFNGNFKSKVLNNEALCIYEWKEGHIKAWAQKIKSNPKAFTGRDFLIEALSVAKKGNLLFTKFNLTYAQIISALVILEATKGRLLQVSTGEGKTTIISVVAVIHSLTGKKVNVMTSSPVLAKRDADQKTGFYMMFDLTAADNADKGVYTKGAKDCYTKDIVYGEVSQFQFDSLRDEYSSLGTLAGRKYEIAIVDEVDSMLIDDSSKIARLASTLPGMDQLQPIYHLLWQRLNSLQDRIISVRDKLYLVNGQVEHHEDNKIEVQFVNEAGDILLIPDFEGYVASGEPLGQIGQVVEENLDTLLMQHLQEYLKAFCLDGKSEEFGIRPEDKINPPKNLNEFVANQIQKWIGNAITALVYRENVQYVIHEGLIKPVDFLSTGTVQDATNWSDGLHQFLQITHNLKMTCETLTTNFLSNVGYFKRYGKNLFGLTGTLGSDDAKEILSTVYEVDLVIIPQQHEKQYLQLPPIIAMNHESWLNEITDAVMYEISKKRGILVICETIEQAELIATRIKEKQKTGDVKVYTRNNMNQEKAIQKIYEKEVIVATNLAGRGTDIKADTIEQNGGLHVCVTFLPANLRIEEQAFGRTSRQGKRGTGQIILNMENLKDLSGLDSLEKSDILTIRNKIEAQRLEEFQKGELKVIEVKDQLFTMFCALLRDLRDDIRSKRGILTKYWDGVKEVFTNVLPSTYEVNLLAAAEEQWALFLRGIDHGKIKRESAVDEYIKFRNVIKEDYKADKLIKNPYYAIVIGNDFLLDDSSFNSKYQESRRYFDMAIALDNKHSTAAFVGIAWSLVKGKAQLFADGHTKDYKVQAVENLAKAQLLLNEEMSKLSAVQALLQHQNKDTETDLWKQLVQKVNLLGSYLNNVNNLVLVIHKSRRLIDITVLKDSQGISEKLKSFFDDKEYPYYDTVDVYANLERNKEGAVENLKKLNEEHDHFDVTFYDQTVRSDSGTIDQALDTVKIAYEARQVFMGKLVYNFAIIKEDYADISLKMKKLGSEEVHALINSDIEFMEITKEEALAQLKEKSSFLHRFLPKGWSPSSYEIELTPIDELGSKEKPQGSMQVKDAITYIEEQSKSKMKFNLTFKDANKEITNVIWEKESLKTTSHLKLGLLNLPAPTVNKIFPNIECLLVELELLGNPKDLEQLVSKFPKPKDLKIQKFRISSTIDPENSKDKPFNCIKIVNLTVDLAKKLLGFCTDSSLVNVNLISITQDSALRLLKDFPTLVMNIELCQLGKAQASALIPLLRDKKIDFSLVFNRLKFSQVETLIKKASIDQEEIEIKSVKTLSDLFTNTIKPIIELQELSCRGIEYLVEIGEKGFIPWRSILTVLALAAVQMVIGGVLVATGFGASVGIGLITEGVADLFTAARAYSSRDFSWTDYAKQKAVSLVISATTMGLTAIKNACKGASNLVKGSQTVATEAVEAAGQKLITGGKTIETTIKTTGENLKSLAVKQIGVSAGEQALQEGLILAADKLSSFMLGQFKPMISDSLQVKVSERFRKSNLNELMKKMLAIDKKTGQTTLKKKIDQIVSDTINPEHNFCRKQWDTVGAPLIKGIFSSPKLVGSSLSMIIRILGTLSGLHELGTLIDVIHNQIEEKLVQMSQESLSISDLLEQYCGITPKVAKEICITLQKGNIVKDSHLLNLDCYKQIQNSDLKEVFSKIEFNEHDNHKSKIIEFFADLYKNAYEGGEDQLSMIIKSVSDTITEQIIRITESQLISPWSSYGMGKLADEISKRVQSRFLVNKNQDSASQKKDDARFKHLKDKLQKGDQLSEQEIREYQRLSSGHQIHKTIEEQIMGNAKDHTIASSQRDQISFALKESDKGKATSNLEKVKSHIDNIIKGEAATLPDMFAGARVLGLEINIVDDPGYQLTEEEKKKGTSVVVFTKGGIDQNGQDQTGHYQVLNSDGKLEDVKSKGYDCGFAVLAHLHQMKTKNQISVEELRLKIVNRIAQNGSSFIHALEAQDWISGEYFREARSLLLKGGVPPKEAKDFTKSTVKQKKGITSLFPTDKNLPLDESEKATVFTILYGNDEMPDNKVYENTINDIRNHLNLKADNRSYNKSIIIHEVFSTGERKITEMISYNLYVVRVDLINDLGSTTSFRSLPQEGFDELYKGQVGVPQVFTDATNNIEYFSEINLAYRNRFDGFFMPACRKVFGSGDSIKVVHSQAIGFAEAVRFDPLRELVSNSINHGGKNLKEPYQKIVTSWKDKTEAGDLDVRVKHLPE